MVDVSRLDCYSCGICDQTSPQQGQRAWPPFFEGSSAWASTESWNRSVVCRPSVSQSSLNLMHRFLSNFDCCFPWAIRSDIFNFWNLNLYLFFANIFLFRYHGTLWEKKIQNGTPPTNCSRKCQISPAISSQWSSQRYCFGFCNFEFTILTNFLSFSLTWDPMGAKSSKRYVSQITIEYFETCPEVSSY